MSKADIDAQRHDKVVELLMDVKERMSAVEEHLKTLNGKVITHEIRLNEQDIKIQKLNKTINTWIGGLGVIILIIQLVML